MERHAYTDNAYKIHQSHLFFVYFICHPNEEWSYASNLASKNFFHIDGNLHEEIVHLKIIYHFKKIFGGLEVSQVTYHTRYMFVC